MSTIPGLPGVLPGASALIEDDENSMWSKSKPYNQEEHNYLNLLKGIIERGSKREDRTGVGTLSLFGTRLRFSLENGKVPLLTTKKMFTKGIIEELLFFIRGETDTKKLEEKGVKIWTGNTSREFLDKRRLTNYSEGEMGPMYGFQWRHFGGSFDADKNHPFHLKNPGVDQLQNCFDLIKNDPTSRRIMITAYNPEASKYSVLDPCHMFFQFYVDDGKLSLQWYQRSVDAGLGLPFNILSYAVLTRLMAQATGLKPGELIFVGGDTHIYLNHVEPLKEQIMREPYEFSTMNIKKDISSIDDMEKMSFEDFEFVGYQSHAPIKMQMAV